MIKLDQYFNLIYFNYFYFYQNSFHPFLNKKNNGIYKGIRTPIILASKTVHAGFDKACQLLGCQIKLIHIPIDPKTMKVDLKKMRKAINKNVCLLVGSAPQYPHGIIDPIEEISKLGLEFDIPVHVDSCLGGFLMPFVQVFLFNL